MSKEIQRKLRKELKRLVRKYGIGRQLTLIYQPELHIVEHPKRGIVGGELKDNVIRVYDLNEEEALHTVRHEFFEKILEAPIQPWQSVVKALTQALEEITYYNKEQAIEALVRVEEESING